MQTYSMILYRTGMSIPEQTAVLMEMAGSLPPRYRGNTNFQIHISMMLIPEHLKIISDAIPQLRNLMAARGRGFDPRPIGSLHLSSMTVNTDQFMRGNIQKALQPFEDNQIDYMYYGINQQWGNDKGYLGIQLRDQSGTCERFRQQCIEAVSPYGIPDRSQYSPHITIGTFPGEDPTDDEQMLIDLDEVSFKGFQISAPRRR